MSGSSLITAAEGAEVFNERNFAPVEYTDAKCASIKYSKSFDALSFQAVQTTTKGAPRNIEIALHVINGKDIPAVTSIQVAEHFGKEHFNVLNDIRRTIDKCSESFTALNFQVSEYTGSTGRNYLKTS